MLKTSSLIAAAAVVLLPVGMSSALAGDITAEIQNGHLYIYGTDEDSSISITSGGPYEVEVSGHTTNSGESTFVNGQENGTVVLNGWTRGIFIENYGGADEITIQDLISTGPVTIDQGFGDDQLYIGTDQGSEGLMSLANFDGSASALTLVPSVELNSYLLVYTGDGHDDVVMRGTHVKRSTTIGMGTGDDYFSAGGGDMAQTVLENNVFLLPGDGIDEVELQELNFARNLVVYDTDGPLTMNVQNTEVGESAFIYGTAQNDQIMAENWNMGDFLLLITYEGNDRVSYSGMSADATIYTGAGNDMVELYNMNSGNIIVQTAGGDDRTWLSSAVLNRFDLYGSADDDYFKIRSTTADEGYVYGSFGEDTVETTTTFPNFINRYRTYGVENEDTTLN